MADLLLPTFLDGTDANLTQDVRPCQMGASTASSAGPAYRRSLSPMRRGKQGSSTRPLVAEQSHPPCTPPEYRRAAGRQARADHPRPRLHFGSRWQRDSARVATLAKYRPLRHTVDFRLDQRLHVARRVSYRRQNIARVGVLARVREPQAEKRCPSGHHRPRVIQYLRAVEPSPVLVAYRTDRKPPCATGRDLHDVHGLSPAAHQLSYVDKLPEMLIRERVAESGHQFHLEARPFSQKPVVIELLLIGVLPYIPEMRQVYAPQVVGELERNSLLLQPIAPLQILRAPSGEGLIEI